MRFNSRVLSLLLVLPLLLVSFLAVRADTVHVVEVGDSLFRIALKYGTTVDAIAQANNIVNPNLIVVGQELIIPGVDGPAAPAPSQPAAPVTPPTGDVVHVVVPGDSLSKISIMYNVPMATIVEANGIANPQLIQVGQELVIPGATTGATTTSAAPATTTAAAPPAPEAPPVAASTNLFPNPSFDDDWHYQGANELQIPNGWNVFVDEGPITVTTNPDDVFFRPEIRVVPKSDLPESEHDLFVFDGWKTVKAFKGDAPTSFAMFTDVALDPGTYRMVINFFPDIVANVTGAGSERWSKDPLASEFRFVHNTGGTDYEPTGAGSRVSRSYEFTLTRPEIVRLGGAFRSRFPSANNGFFLDNWSLEKID